MEGLLFPDPWLALLAAASAGLLALGVVILYRVRRDPREREKRRRLHVTRRGRLCEAFITEASSEIIHFKYSIGGVDYTASQEVGELRHLLPPRPESLIGFVYLRYIANNPANSVLLSEEWSGLKAMARGPVDPPTPESAGAAEPAG